MTATRIYRNVEAVNLARRLLVENGVPDTIYFDPTADVDFGGLMFAYGDDAIFLDIGRAGRLGFLASAPDQIVAILALVGVKKTIQEIKKLNSNHYHTFFQAV
jgi:hypothetical protein